jgi:hypothetical protein
MKTITLIGIAALLCVPASASAQRGGGAAGAPRVNVQRVEIRRVDPGRMAIDPGRDYVVARGRLAELDTGTRIRRPDPDRRRFHHARRRWNAAHPDPNPRRRWYNATHPSDADPSRRPAGD